MKASDKGKREKHYIDEMVNPLRHSNLKSVCTKEESYKKYEVNV